MEVDVYVILVFSLKLRNTYSEPMLALLPVVLYVTGGPDCDMLSHLEHW